MDPSRLHTLVLNALEEQVAVLDRQGRILEVNQAWRRFGEDNDLSCSDSCVGMNYLDVLAAAVAVGDDHARQAQQGILAVAEGRRERFEFEYPCHSPEEKRWFLMRTTAVHDEHERLLVVSHHNITRRRLAEEEAREMAMHDPLTGLANRRAFDLFLEREARRSRRDQVPVSLIVVDVDHFKAYNDEFGHPAGDECLARLGRILLEASARPGDLAVRLGGDEFLVVLGETDRAGARAVAESIRDAVHACEPVPGTSRRLSVSLGVATRIYDAWTPEQALLEEADQALYRAKSAGRDGIGLHPPDHESGPDSGMPRAS